MADVETKKVEEETTTTIKEVSKEVAAGEPVVVPDEKPEAEIVADEPVAKEGENGTAAEEQNGSSNGNGSTNGVESAETTEEVDGNKIEEVRKRKSEGIEVGDATDGVSAEKKAKLEEKSEAVAEDGIEAPANGEAEVTA